jgi:hypothetical protein
MGEYHGIILNLSQTDRTIFCEIRIIGNKQVLFGLIALYKICVAPEDLDALIERIQAKMANRIFFLRKEFYCHFYRGSELIIVFRQRVFHVKTVPESWSEAIAYGRYIGIPANQLDFSPCRIEDERY